MSVFIQGGSLEVDGAAVLDTVAGEGLAMMRGVEVQEGARLRARVLLVGGAGDRGMAVFDEGSDLWDATVADTGGLPCDGPAGCEPGGVGVAAFRGAYANLQDFLVTRSALAGVQLGGGTMDLRRGEISHGLIGAAVDTDGFDVERLTDEVLYLDNGVNLDTVSLPVPSSGQGAPRFVPNVSETVGL